MNEEKFFKTKIIEVFGLPRTGKTTSVNALKKQLINDNLKAEIIKERASVSPIKDKLHPLFNYWTALSFMKAYIEAIDNDVDFLIADRGLLDSLVWVDYLAKGNGKKSLLHPFEKLIDQNFIFSNYAVSFFLDAKTDDILDREYNSNEDNHKKRGEGKIINEVVLDGYRKSYYNNRNEIKRELIKGSEIIEINSSELTLEEVSNTIIDKVLNLYCEPAL